MYDFLSFVFCVQAAFFDSAAMAMPGCSQFFLLNANEEHEHARVFATFLNQKGGKLALQDIKVSTQCSIKEAVKHSYVKQ